MHPPTTTTRPGAVWMSNPLRLNKLFLTYSRTLSTVCESLSESWTQICVCIVIVDCNMHISIKQCICRRRATPWMVDRKRSFNDHGRGSPPPLFVHNAEDRAAPLMYNIVRTFHFSRADYFQNYDICDVEPLSGFSKDAFCLGGGGKREWSCVFIFLSEKCFQKLFFIFSIFFFISKFTSKCRQRSSSLFTPTPRARL